MRDRRIAIIVIAAVIALCCCCAVTFGGLISYFAIQGLSEQNGRPSGDGPIIVVTSVSTPLPRSTNTPRAKPQATPTGHPNAATPSGSTPSDSKVTPTAPSASTGELDTAALLAQADMPERDLRDLALRLKPGTADIPKVVNATPPSYKVGDTAPFWISNDDTKEHHKVNADLRFITDHVYMWVAQGVEVNQSDLETSARRFEEKTYPTNREFFGSEWTPGVDNDVHLNILYARDMGKTIAGYYSSADEFSKMINPYSNEREMIYTAADSGSAKPNTSFYDGVLAHEFQHMIHWANDRNEDSWVNEGMSMLAERLNGFDVGGADIAYSEKPDTQLTTWADSTAGNSEHYGASYLFMDYFLDRFGENLTKAVVASPKDGIAGFNDALAKADRSETFDDIYADWLVANYLDRPDAEPKGRFGYPDIDPQAPAVEETYQRFPVSGSTDVSQYGADYIRLKGRGPLTIDFTGQPQVELVNAKPKEAYAWWSNRGDDSDATLTRSFDLRNLESAALTFSTWYDLEDGYDYAYVEVSTDGGAHWQILPGQHTTDKNPSGNAFGPGWTGVSGGGKTPTWISERVDLSSVAGKEIKLRFEYVTDDAVNGPGLLLDNISIPELGYTEGGEAGEGGWEAAGWALTDNKLAQKWLVQLVEVGRDGVRVQRMPVGADGRGQITTDDLSNLSDAMLIVSGLAPVTTERAKYEYTIAPK